MPAAARWSTRSFGPPLRRGPPREERAKRVVRRSSHSTKRTVGNVSLKASSSARTRSAWKPISPPSVFGTPTTTSATASSERSPRRYSSKRSEDTTSRGRARRLSGSDTATPVRASPMSRAAIRPRESSAANALPLLGINEPLAQDVPCFEESLRDSVYLPAPGLGHGGTTASAAAQDAGDLLDDLAGLDLLGDLGMQVGNEYRLAPQCCP